MASFERITTSNGLQPDERSEHAMASNGQYVFVFGGCGKNACPLNDLWMINWKTNKKKQKWLNLSSGSYKEWPSPRYLSRMIYAPELNSIYIFGGFIDTTGGKTNNELWQFNIDKNDMLKVQPKKGTKLPRKRAAHIMGYSNFKIYVHGGSDGSYHGLNEKNIIHMYDIKSQIWTKIKIKNNGAIDRSFHASTIYYNYWIIHGGFNNIGTCEIIDLINYKSITLKWKLKRDRHEMWCIQDKIVIFGGSVEKNKKSNELIIFNSIQNLINNERKEIKIKNITPRMSHKGCVINGNQIVLFGGYDFTWLNDLYLLNPGDGYNTTPIKTIDIFKLVEEQSSILETNEILLEEDTKTNGKSKTASEVINGIWKNSESFEIQELKNEIHLLKNQLQEAQKLNELKTSQVEKIDREKNQMRILSNNLLKSKDAQIDEFKHKVTEQEEEILRLKNDLNEKTFEIKNLVKDAKKNKNIRLKLTKSLRLLEDHNSKLLNTSLTRMETSVDSTVNKLLY